MKLLANLIAFGRATLVDDGGELQLVQVTEKAFGTGFADRIIDHVRRLTEFGFSSVPPAESEVLVIRRGGDRGQSIVIATSHRPSRPRSLQPGDACLYDVRGARILLGPNGIEVDGGGRPVTVKNTPKVRLETDLLEVTGDVVSRADGSRVSLNGVRDAYVAHKHLQVKTGTDVSGASDHTGV